MAGELFARDAGCSSDQKRGKASDKYILTTGQERTSFPGSAENMAYAARTSNREPDRSTLMPTSLYALAKGVRSANIRTDRISLAGPGILDGLDRVGNALEPARDACMRALLRTLLAAQPSLPGRSVSTRFP